MKPLQPSSAFTVELANPFSDEAQACIQAYFEELQTRFAQGFDPALTVSANPQELLPPQGCWLIARQHGKAVGCGGLKIRNNGNGDEVYGEIKRMWVASAARGQGIAQRLLQALESHAAAAGVRVLQLDTNRDLVEARALYLRHGYTEIPAYNTNPYAHHWFEKRLPVSWPKSYEGASTLPAGIAPVGPITLATGYQTGLIARVTDLHARYYARTFGFGQRFESLVAAGLADFCDRLDHPGNQIWRAMQADTLVGAVAIDAQDLGHGLAHLRWFIVDEAARGSGIGRLLLGGVLAFVDQQGLTETRLWTFSGLDAARHLYEAHGFNCVEERSGTRWGSQVLEQLFVRRRPL